eukprot:790753-Amphidinium_carterae.1
MGTGPAASSRTRCSATACHPAARASLHHTSRRAWWRPMAGPQQQLWAWRPVASTQEPQIAVRPARM